MKLFVDCEFNSFHGDLISMALVSSEGHEWYRSLGCDNPHPWVAEHVMPVIGIDPCERVSFVLSLALFLEQFSAVHIIADWPEDIAYFCQSLITGPGGRVDTPPLTMEVRRDLDAVSAVPHNALADARAIRDLYLSQLQRQGLR